MSSPKHFIPDEIAEAFVDAFNAIETILRHVDGNTPEGDEYHNFLLEKLDNNCECECEDECECAYEDSDDETQKFYRELSSVFDFLQTEGCFQ